MREAHAVEEEINARRVRQRLHPPNDLAGDAERRPARGQNTHAVRGFQDAFDAFRARARQMFAVVEEQRDAPIPQQLADGNVLVDAASIGCEDLGDGAIDRRAGRYASEIHEPDAVGDAAGDRPPDAGREPRFADAGRPDEAHQSRSREQFRRRFDFALATDERRELQGQRSARAIILRVRGDLARVRSEGGGGIGREILAQQCPELLVCGEATGGVAEIPTQPHDRANGFFLVGLGARVDRRVAQRGSKITVALGRRDDPFQGLEIERSQAFALFEHPQVVARLEQIADVQARRALEILDRACVRGVDEITDVDRRDTVLLDPERRRIAPDRRRPRKRGARE